MNDIQCKGCGQYYKCGKEPKLAIPAINIPIVLIATVGYAAYLLAMIIGGVIGWVISIRK